MSELDNRVPDSAFVPLDHGATSAEPDFPPALSFLQDSWRKLRRNRAAVAAMALLVLSVMMALLAPVLAPYPPNEQHLQFKNLPPRIPGVGMKIPNASLGTLLNGGYKVFRLYPYQMFIPTAVLCAIMLSFNMFADGLRDVFDPKMKE